MAAATPPGEGLQPASPPLGISRPKPGEEGHGEPRDPDVVALDLSVQQLARDNGQLTTKVQRLESFVVDLQNQADLDAERVRSAEGLSSRVRQLEHQNSKDTFYLAVLLCLAIFYYMKTHNYFGSYNKASWQHL